MSIAVMGYMTLGEVATHFNCDSWQIRRLFKRGFLPEPERLGNYRVVKEEDLPKIQEALHTAGYLKANKRKRKGD